LRAKLAIVAGDRREAAGHQYPFVLDGQAGDGTIHSGNERRIDYTIGIEAINKTIAADDQAPIGQRKRRIDRNTEIAIERIRARCPQPGNSTAHSVERITNADFVIDNARNTRWTEGVIRILRCENERAVPIPVIPK
jgi:hypothetical protein